MNTTTVATSTNATAQPSAPVAAFVAHQNAMALASSGLNLSTPKGAFDAIVAFGKSIGAPMPLTPSHFRQEILRLTSLSATKGKVSGITTTTRGGFSFNGALKEYQSHGPDETRDTRKEDVKAFRQVCAIWRAYGGMSFTVDSE